MIRTPRSLVLFCSTALATSVLAQGLDEVVTSPDVTIDLETPSTVATDEDAPLDVGGTVALSDLGFLPAGAELVGYHLLANGDQLFVLDTATTLAGPVDSSPRSVIRRTPGGVHSVEFDGASEGVPAGAQIDALSVDTAGDLILSFDTTVSPTGSGVTIADEDLVLFELGTSTYLLLFDGSAAGVDESLDLDAAHYILGTKNPLVSFDQSGSVGGVTFDDEDVLEFDTAGFTWSKRVDLSDRDTDWQAADLGAFHIVPGLCGDASDDAFVNQDDSARLQQLFANPGVPLTTGGMDKCSVIGSTLDCDLRDWVVLVRSLPAPGVIPGIAPVCQAAN